MLALAVADPESLATFLDKARTDAHRLELENERLQVDKRAQTTPARIERLAREKLLMRQAKPGITTYVTYAEPAAGMDAASLVKTVSAASGVAP